MDKSTNTKSNESIYEWIEQSVVLRKDLLSRLAVEIEIEDNNINTGEGASGMNRVEVLSGEKSFRGLG